ncbi:MAG: hypothetical protein JWM53_4714 [bacterium]|nr:hypothetical protein [bacterium]
MPKTLARPSARKLSTTVPPVNPHPAAVVRIALIGCGKKKLEGKHRARDLYTGPLFKAALAHAARTADETFVLSAAHGLLPLDQEVDSYDRPLRAASKLERESWAYRVCLDLRQRMRGRRFEVFIYAGETYADPIESYLALLDRSVAVTTPLSGLTLGYQLRWFRVAAIVGGTHVDR